MPINIPNAFESIANALSVGNNIAYNLVEFNNSGTYTEPANLLAMEIFIGCAGAGGASGSRRASGVIAQGGAPGNPGLCAWFFLPAGTLVGPHSVIVGAGGTKGASVTADDTNGTSSTAGGASSFNVLAGPSSPGVDYAGISAWAPTFVGSYSIGFDKWVNPAVYPFGWRGLGWQTIPSGTVYTSTGVGNSGLNQELIGGGGGGGGIPTSNVQYRGQYGGTMVYEWGTQKTANPEGGDASSGNGHGGHGYNNFQLENAAGPLMKLTNSFGTLALGSGGGGGASRTAAKGGDGGNTGNHCAGGAGGGSSRNGYDSGQGADGANGFVKILEILRV